MGIHTAIYSTGIFLLLTGYTLHAQYNDSTHYMAAIQANGTISQTNDGLTVLYNNSLKGGVKFNSFVMNAGSSWIYGKTPVKQSNNDWNTSLDFNIYKTFPHFYYWGLLNHTSSYSLKIPYQLQGGLGIAYRIWDKPHFRCSISNGILYETSSIVPVEQDTLKYATFRNSLRLQVNYTLKELVRVRAIGFYQPSLQYKNDYIINANASIQVKLWKWLHCNTTATYNKASRTRRENFLFTYGLTAEYYF